MKPARVLIDFILIALGIAIFVWIVLPTAKLWWAMNVLR